MRQLLKKAALLLPPLRRLVDAREALAARLAVLSQERDILRDERDAAARKRNALRLELEVDRSGCDKQLSHRTLRPLPAPEFDELGRLVMVAEDFMDIEHHGFLSRLDLLRQWYLRSHPSITLDEKIRLIVLNLLTAKYEYVRYAYVTPRPVGWFDFSTVHDPDYRNSKRYEQARHFTMGDTSFATQHVASEKTGCIDCRHRRGTKQTSAVQMPGFTSSAIA